MVEPPPKIPADLETALQGPRWTKSDAFAGIERTRRAIESYYEAEDRELPDYIHELYEAHRAELGGKDECDQGGGPQDDHQPPALTVGAVMWDMPALVIVHLVLAPRH